MSLSSDTPLNLSREALNRVKQAWETQWQRALSLWSKFTRLSEPRWCFDQGDELQEQLQGSFAMIRFADQAVVISLRQIVQRKLEGFALEIMGHEIGHHVYAPGDLTDQGRMLARMRRVLPTVEDQAPMVANLYTDLLINDRLQRSAAVNMAGVYRALAAGAADRMWTFYMRIYEILWSLPRKTLATGNLDDALEGDAQLGARLIRSYARDWLKGAGKFAALCLPYLLNNEAKETARRLEPWMDTARAGAGQEAPQGLTEVEPDEGEGAIDPLQDPELTGEADGAGSRQTQRLGGAAGQHREPFEYGAILRGLGLNLSEQEVTIRYYRERALPHLIPFPAQLIPESSEPLAEGLEPWDAGSPLEEVDWFESVVASPHVVPGVTTLRRSWGTMDGALPEREPVDLDLYVDCSGSMPNPAHQLSYVALASVIIALSALRVGSRVQATLWSGPGQFMTTSGFVCDERSVLRILTGYLGGSTAFPIHKLRDTYRHRKPGERAVHILVVSDDGVDTMLQNDEQRNSGESVARTALARARGGGSLVLNLAQELEAFRCFRVFRDLGWEMHRVGSWDELIEFARAFSRRNYAPQSRP